MSTQANNDNRDGEIDSCSDTCNWREKQTLKR